MNVNLVHFSSLTFMSELWLKFLVNWNEHEWTWLIFLVNWNLSSQRCMEEGHNLTQIIHYLNQIIHYYNFFFSNFHKKVFHFIFRKRIMHIFCLHHELFHEREWSWLIFLLNKNSWMWVIVAHFFWEVIVSDLAHEKSELAQLWLQKTSFIDDVIIL